MQAIETLEKTDNFLSETLQTAKEASPLNKNCDDEIHKITLKIKKNLEVNYSIPSITNSNELERIKQIYVNYLLGKTDDFNSHYIQILAWNLFNLKIMKTKSGEQVSVFEYSPNPLVLYSVVEKTFKLFEKRRISTKKVSYALLITYLNNYKSASNRYKNNLRKYLKDIKFQKYTSLFFVSDYEKIFKYFFKLSQKFENEVITFPEWLSNLKIPESLLNTTYFSDLWAYWFFHYADLYDTKILNNLNCVFFRKCDENLQKIILAYIIYLKCRVEKYSDMTELCLRYIFPVIKKGNPLKREFWNIDCDKIYKTYLDYAWNFIEENFVKNPVYKNLVESADFKR